MKSSAKAVALLLCLVMVLSVFAGCGKSTPANNASNNEVPANDVPANNSSDAGPAVSEEEMTKLIDIAKAGAEAIGSDRVNEGTYPIKVASGSEQFKIKDSKLVSVAGVLQLVLNVEGDTYSKIFAGSAADAASAGSVIDGEKNADGTTTFRIPVKSLNEVIKFAAYADEYGKWFDRTLLADASSLDSAAIKPIETADGDDKKDEKKDDSKKDDSKKDDTPKQDDTPKDDPKPDDTPKEDPQPDDTPADDPKPDDTPQDDPKQDDAPKDDTKPDDTPQEDPKPDDTPKDDSKPDDTPKDDPQPDDTPGEDPKPDEPPADDPEPDDPPQEDPQPDDPPAEEPDDGLADGDYSVGLTFSGGTGKARILSPATLHVSGGKMTATVKWSSSNYDYMLVGGVKYLPISTAGGSTFVIPISALDTNITVIGDTTAMSVPHEVEYTIRLDSSTLVKQ